MVGFAWWLVLQANLEREANGERSCTSLPARCQDLGFDRIILKKRVEGGSFYPAKRTLRDECEREEIGTMDFHLQ